MTGLWWPDIRAAEQRRSQDPETVRMSIQHRIPGSGTRRFDDPDQYQAAIRGGDSQYSFLGRGAFRAELTSIEVGKLTLQRGRETIPRLAASGMPPNKVGILLWFGESHLPIVRGEQMRRGDWMCLGLDMQSYHRTSGPNDFAVLTLDAGDLARAAVEQTGRELTVTAGKVIRPPDHLRARLLSVVEAATRLGRTTPGTLASPQAAAALEQALLRPMIMCLIDGEARAESLPRHRRAGIARRFAAAVEAYSDQPLPIPDLCRIIGVPGRTLRAVCEEQLGMSPQRFTALHRLHLIRRALLRSDPRSTTVTEIATNCGVWELGRFAVAYKSLFGESPSATLRLPLDVMEAEIPLPFGTEPYLHSVALSSHI